MKKLSVPVIIVSMMVGLITCPTVSADDMDDWTKAVTKIVAAKQGYPRLAVARQIEGKAKVKLTVTADGTITNYEILEPTGEEVLDQAIPKLIGRLSPLPPLPKGQPEMTFVLPLTWSLN